MRTKRAKVRAWRPIVPPWDLFVHSPERAPVLVVPASATEAAITAGVCRLVDETARLIGVVVREMGEREAANMPEGDRLVWLAERGPTARDVAAATYAGWADALPAAPNDDTTCTFGDRLQGWRARGRGVYLRLSIEYRRMVTVWAVDSRGRVLGAMRVADDGPARAQIVRTLWELLDRQDPQASDLPGGYRDGYGETIDDSADDFGDGW